MRALVFSPKFKRAYRKFVKHDRALRRRVHDVLGQMRQDIFATSLRTHKLSGELSGLSACSRGYDCRMCFLDEEDDQELIVLVDIGTHDEVY